MGISVEIQVPQPSGIPMDVGGGGGGGGAEVRSNHINSNVMTIEEYNDVHWRSLRGAIDTMFTHPPGGFRPISYEEMYSAVYKCVCKQYSEKLYQDLMNHTRTRVAEWSRHMQENRFYIEAKLKTNLQTELLKIYSTLFVDPHIKRLIPLMVSAQASPFAVQPEMMASICKHLHQLNPEYVREKPSLFQHYLPNIGPAMREDEIERQRESERQLQVELREQGWAANIDNSRRKREFEEDSGPPT